MAPNEQARKNHDELFPGHVSTLAVTDPELIETFDNFAFDEVLRDSNLDTRTRLMVQLAAIIASQALGEYRVMLGAGFPVGQRASDTRRKPTRHSMHEVRALVEAFDTTTARGLA